MNSKKPRNRENRTRSIPAEAMISGGRMTMTIGAIAVIISVIIGVIIGPNLYKIT